MADAVAQNEIAGQPRNFEDLLKAKASFFRKMLGAEELELLQTGQLDDTNSIDINPQFECHHQYDAFWRAVIASFSKNDPGLKCYLNNTENAAKYLIEHFFNPSNLTGLAMLMVGNYNTKVFNRKDVTDAAGAFLDAANPEDYMLITACSEEVMVEPVGHRKWENKFLRLITDEKYSDIIFPFKLPERPEFRFLGRLYGPGGNFGRRCEMAFYVNGVAADDLL